MLLLLEIIPYVTIFLFGIVVGSFLNVCIYRLPKQESIVKVPSHCMSCGAQLRWYDLVPLFSWLILRGRCRRCKAAISIQYPLIEGLNGILWVFVFVVNGMNGMSLVYCFMTSALLTLSVIDWRTFEIPFGINVFLGILGLVAVVLDKEEWLSHIIGAVCVSVFLCLNPGESHWGRRYKADGSVRATDRMAENHSGIFTGLYFRIHNPYNPNESKRRGTYPCDGSLSGSRSISCSTIWTGMDYLVSFPAWNLTL